MKSQVFGLLILFASPMATASELTCRGDMPDGSKLIVDVGSLDSHQASTVTFDVNGKRTSYTAQPDIRSPGQVIWSDPTPRHGDYCAIRLTVTNSAANAPSSGTFSFSDAFCEDIFEVPVRCSENNIDVPESSSRAREFNPECATEISLLCPAGQEDSCIFHPEISPRACIAQADSAPGPCTNASCKVSLGLDPSQIYGTFTFDGHSCQYDHYDSMGLRSCTDTRTFDCRTGKHNHSWTCSDPVDPSGW